MNTATPQQLVTTARSYLGTPFVHQGRLKGKGIDCVGLLVCTGRELGLTDYDYTRYPQTPGPAVITDHLDRALLPVPNLADRRLGDVLVFWIRRPQWPQHAGILTDYGLLHTHTGVGKVVEHVLDDRWLERLVRVYRYPGVD